MCNLSFIQAWPEDYKLLIATNSQDQNFQLWNTLGFDMNLKARMASLSVVRNSSTFLYRAMTFSSTFGQAV